MASECDRQTESPESNPTAPSPAPFKKAAADAIAGCYQWFNNQPVVIHGDGTMVGGPFTARWRVVNAARREYTFTWPEATDTVTISADQQSLSGANQYGFATLGGTCVWRDRRVGRHLALAERRPRGCSSRWNIHGRHLPREVRRATDAARGIYTLTWPNPVDSVILLSPDGSRVSGANQ